MWTDQADFSSCGRWEGLTGKELELEHQEEKAAVWLTLGWSLGCRWESCCAAIWGKSDFRLAGDGIHYRFHRHLLHNNVSFKPSPSRFWVLCIPASRQSQLPQPIPLMILPYPIPVLQPFIRPPVIAHKPYSKQISERERQSSCQPCPEVEHVRVEADGSPSSDVISPLLLLSPQSLSPPQTLTW